MTNELSQTLGHICCEMSIARNVIMKKEVSYFSNDLHFMTPQYFNIRIKLNLFMCTVGNQNAGRSQNINRLTGNKF